MKTRNDLSHNRLLMACIVAVMLLAVLIVASPAYADLPPRPSNPTGGGGGSGGGGQPPKPQGGWIELHALPINDPDVWCVVQWQDGLGAWHDVDAWRGQFDLVADSVGVKTWWVNQYTFGPTPYRWVIYQGSSNKILSQSNAFNLPETNKQKVIVEVSLTP